MPRQTEYHSIVLCGEMVSYTLERKKIKNINMRMYSGTGLAVSVPYNMPLEEIEEILRQNEKRLLTSLHKFSHAAQDSVQQYPDTYVTGETVLYLGKIYVLEVMRGTRECVQLQEDRLLLLVRDPADEKRRKKVFDTWWNSTCEKAVRNLCRAVYPVFAAHEVQFPEIRFRAMVSQWGNCRPQRGVLTFNTRLLAAPVRCMEYVVIHEFTHFLYPNHSRQFYQFIEAELPDWKQLQDILQKNVKTRLNPKKIGDSVAQS
ncbi:MAG: M48 family metallopeptidase [Ruminococcus sp.]